MGIVVRLVVALAVFLTQSSIGLAFCACPAEVPAPVTQKATQSCPMGMKTCCACCKTQAKKPSPGKAPAPKKCEAKASESGQNATLTAALLSFDEVILTESHLLCPVLTGHRELPVPQHLVVPRTRPPNPRLHGLRAPPTR